MWYHLQSLSSDVFLGSPLHVAKPPHYCFPVYLCSILYLQSLPDAIVSHMFSQCVAARPSPHLHFCHFQVNCHWHCLHPALHCWLNDHLVDISLNVWGIILSHRTPDIFLQLFHPHRVLLFTSLFASSLLCWSYYGVVTCVFKHQHNICPVKRNVYYWKGLQPHTLTHNSGTEHNETNNNYVIGCRTHEYTHKVRQQSIVHCQTS